MHLHLLPYQSNSESIFTHFANRPYSIFLDSGGVGRFDIIVADPYRLITARDITEDPFTLAKHILQEQKDVDFSNIPADLPFTIGAIGYFSYDLGYSIQELQPSTAFDINIPAALIGFYNWSIVTDHLHQQTYFISRNPQDPNLAFIQTLIDNPPPITGHFRLLENFQPNMDKSHYAAAFNQAKKYIHAGDCYQINLAQRFITAYNGSPWLAYRRLRQQNPMPMSAFIHFPEGDILSLSPERFLQIQNQQVLTEPIKGTSPRFSDPEQDRLSAESLLSSEKDQAENMMIVDLLRNDLGKCCRPGTIQVPRLCELKSFTNVHHLVSTITGTLEESQHPFDLFKQCFPGGSITGAPKRRAMEIIEELEPHHRSVYCGSIAYCDVRGHFDSSITIRTFICNNQKIYCYGGGGIVFDSQLESEYHEIQTKISRLLKTLETTID